MKSLLKNIKTTFMGSVSGLPILVNGVQHKDLSQILTGLGLFLVGLFSKDHNA